MVGDTYEPGSSDRGQGMGRETNPEIAREQRMLETYVSPEVREIIRSRVFESIADYDRALREDGEELELRDLAPGAQQELRQHIEQLKDLQVLLGELVDNPAAFERVVNKVNRDEGSTTVRLRRRSDGPLRRGEQNSQTQLSFHVKATRHGETEDELLQSLSLRGVSPESTLDRRDQILANGGSLRGPVAQRITVNTIHVYRDEKSTRLAARSGVVIGERHGGTFTAGLKFVGARAHYMPLAVDTVRISSAEVKRLIAMGFHLATKEG